MTQAWRGGGPTPSGGTTRAQVTDATGGAPPAYVARGSLVVVVFILAATAVAAALTVTNRAGDGGLPGGWVAATLALADALATAWWWARRPQVVVGALGVWLARTLQHPCEVHLWPGVDAVVHGRARTNGPRSFFLGVRTRNAAPGTVTPDVQAALDGTAALDALLPGTGSFVAEVVRDGQRLRVRTVRASAVRDEDTLRRAVAAAAPGVPVERPGWMDASLGEVAARGVWSALRRRH